MIGRNLLLLVDAIINMLLGVLWGLVVILVGLSAIELLTNGKRNTAPRLY